MVRANRIPIKAVNKVQYQWGKYCMINVCSMDVPWMSLPFFLSFNPLAPNYCFPYNFYDSEMFFRLVVSMGPRRHCFLTRTQDFSFCHGHARDKTKKFHNYNDTFLFNFYNIGLENLVLDELTISLSMLFFIPTTFWLDFVRRNSVSVTHKSERVISHCN